VCNAASLRHYLPRRGSGEVVCYAASLRHYLFPEGVGGGRVLRGLTEALPAPD